jgi:hypothetical protein
VFIHNKVIPGKSLFPLGFREAFSERRIKKNIQASLHKQQDQNAAQSNGMGAHYPKRHQGTKVVA